MAADIYTFIPHHFRLKYEALGWVYCGKDDAYTACYVWRGEGDLVFPTNEDWDVVVELDSMVSYEDIWGEVDG